MFIKSGYMVNVMCECICVIGNFFHIPPRALIIGKLPAILFTGAREIFGGQKECFVGFKLLTFCIDIAVITVNNGVS